MECLLSFQAGHLASSAQEWAITNIQLAMVPGRTHSLHSLGQWGNPEYTSIICQPVQEDTGNMWTLTSWEALRCLPVETFNQIQMSPKTHLCMVALHLGVSISNYIKYKFNTLLAHHKNGPCGFKVIWTTGIY